MTSPDLQDLAADCEARAANGEKPVLRWVQNNLGWTAHTAPDRPHVFEMSNGRFDVFGHPNVNLSSVAAAQLFAEALLRSATLALHPAPEPHVAAAVELARVVLNAWNEDGPIMGTHKWARTSGALHRLGLTEECRTGSRVSALGRALLNCGSPVEPATRDAKESET